MFLRFPTYVTKTAISLYLVLLIVIFVLFPSQILGLQWIFFGLSTVVFFFHNAERLPLKWGRLPEKLFLHKLFLFALLVRVFYVFFSYLYYLEMTGQPFEFGAADAIGYHREGLWMVDLLESNSFYRYFHYLKGGYSDSGYPFFLFMIYLIFGETLLIPRLVNALLGAWMPLHVYQLAKRNFDEGVGRLAGILVAIAPNLIYYVGLHLKETLMLFLTIAFLNNADALMRNRKISLKLIFAILFLGVSLFLFRTVLGVTAFFSLGMAVLLLHKHIISSSRRSTIIFLFGAAGIFIMANLFSNEISYYYESRITNLQDRMTHIINREGGNRLAQYGRTSIFFPLSLISPFPNMVNSNQLNAQMIHGAVFTKNILAFFVFYTLFAFWRKQRFRNHTLLLFYLFTYLGILSSSGFALSERFHLLALPVILIFVAAGIKEISPADRKYYSAYLLLVSFIIIGWCWFKLTGKGVI